jgi:hypothetical protein
MFMNSIKKSRVQTLDLKGSRIPGSGPPPPDFWWLWMQLLGHHQLILLRNQSPCIIHSSHLCKYIQQLQYIRPSLLFVLLFMFYSTENKDRGYDIQRSATVARSFVSLFEEIKSRVSDPPRLLFICVLAGQSVLGDYYIFLFRSKLYIFSTIKTFSESSRTINRVSVYFSPLKIIRFIFCFRATLLLLKQTFCKGLWLEIFDLW